MEPKNKIDEKFFERASRHVTWCNIPVQSKYTPEDVAHLDYKDDIGEPGPMIGRSISTIGTARRPSTLWSK